MNKETTDRIVVAIIGTALANKMKETPTSVLLEGSEAALSDLRANGFEYYRPNDCGEILDVKYGSLIGAAYEPGKYRLVRVGETEQ